MNWPFTSDFTFAVVPVLFGPLQTLLALLPAIALGLGSMLLAALRPSSFKKLLQFLWCQKLFTVLLVGLFACLYTGFPLRYLFGNGSVAATTGVAALSDWGAFQGGPGRPGRGVAGADPTVPRSIWKYVGDKMIYASPAICGDRVIVSTVTEISPFNPTGRGAIVCLEAASGKVVWRYSPADFRATFSSPVVKDGLVICGEGLHQVRDARITCLDINGKLQWQFATNSHVESTASIADGKVFIGAGDDGFYCLKLRPQSGSATTPSAPQVLWHLDGKDFPDCESSPVVADGVVYFSLGIGGEAVCAVDANAGQVLWKIETPYPVFGLSYDAGKLYAGMGNGNYVQSAADLLVGKLEELKASGATAEQLKETEEKFKIEGVLWCIDVASQRVEWKFATGEIILGAIACDGDKLFFSSRDGICYCLSTRGELLRKTNLRNPIVTSPAIGQQHVYVVTMGGRLFCLQRDSLAPVWDVGLGVGMNFGSSPVVSHGHVYVGTESEGVRCLGEPGEPVLPVWSQGERGGPADTEPIGNQASVAWQYPTESSKGFQITAPLMPMGRFVYMVAIVDGAPRLLKLDPHTSDPDADSQRVAWDIPLKRPVTISPVGFDSHLFVLSDSDDASQANAELSCRDVETGNVRWSCDFGMHAEPIVFDSGLLVGRRGKTSLVGLAAEDGRERWSFSLDSAGIGPPTVYEGILLTTTEKSLYALDLLSGRLLWRVDLPRPTISGPVVAGSHAVLATDQGLIRLRVTDGSVVAQLAIGKCVSLPIASSDTVVALVDDRDGSRAIVEMDGEVQRETRRTSGVLMSAAPFFDDTRILFATMQKDRPAMMLSSRHSHGSEGGDWCELVVGQKLTRPLVSLQGNVFAVVDDTAILCLKPAAP